MSSARPLQWPARWPLPFQHCSSAGPCPSRPMVRGRTRGRSATTSGSSKCRRRPRTSSFSAMAWQAGPHAGSPQRCCHPMRFLCPCYCHPMYFRCSIRLQIRCLCPISSISCSFRPFLRRGEDFTTYGHAARAKGNEEPYTFKGRGGSTQGPGQESLWSLQTHLRQWSLEQRTHSQYCTNVGLVKGLRLRWLRIPHRPTPLISLRRASGHPTFAWKPRRAARR